LDLIWRGGLELVVERKEITSWANSSGKKGGKRENDSRFRLELREKDPLDHQSSNLIIIIKILIITYAAMMLA